MTLEALADIDVVHVIDHQVMQAWANGLDDGEEVAIRSAGA